MLDPGELKFFLSNAPAETSVEVLLLVAFSRSACSDVWHEDQKGEIGLDQYEGRRYLGLKRHMLLSAVSYLFLARVRQEERAELTVCQVHTAVAAWFALGAYHRPELRKGC